MIRKQDKMLKEQHTNAREATEGFSRRDALAALAKLSAYSAPTVSLLLASELSHAQGSPIPPGSEECRMGGAGSMHMNAGANHDGNMGTGGNGSDRSLIGDNSADCG